MRGCVFLPRYKGKDGTLRISSIWWMKYRNAAGVVKREACGTDKKRAAVRLLAKRTGAAADGRPTSPHTEKVTVYELLADLENEYLANDRGVARLRHSLAHVRPVFGARRAGEVTTADVNAYIVAPTLPAVLLLSVPITLPRAGREWHHQPRAGGAQARLRAGNAGDAAEAVPPAAHSDAHRGQRPQRLFRVGTASRRPRPSAGGSTPAHDRGLRDRLAHGG